MKNKKIKSKLPENQARHLYREIIEAMLDYSIISEKDYDDIINSHTFFKCTKDNFSFFYKSFKDALIKIKQTKYFKSLVRELPIFENLLTNSLRDGIDLYSNFRYLDDLRPNITELPVKIWLFKNKKRITPKNYYRVIIQSSSKIESDRKNLLTIKLLPKIEIIENYGYKNELTAEECNKILTWIENNRNWLIRASYDYNFYFKKIEELENEH